MIPQQVSEEGATDAAPINPFKQLRLSKRWSQEQVAEAANVNKNLIIRTEQGCYPNPPPVLMEWFLDHFDIPESELLEHYKRFQQETRANNYGILPVEPLVIPQRNPITFLRESNGLSKAQVYIGLCLHPTTIHKLEKQPHLCKNLPPQFVDALIDAGYDQVYVNKLQLAWEVYKHNLDGKVGVTV